MRECWPWGYGYGFRIRNRFIPLEYFNRSLTTLQLLTQADMVRMAAYGYEVGCFITPTPAENPMNMNFGVYIYPKPHTFHELENPKGDFNESI
jgi:hypothetical protein